ncbi:antibiotic biosynthesis monooxygenase [Vibrio sp. Isolate25]|uniref:putative quinol monooxygenase n=1 Tax=Vibrio TaxID=662 RepID=UPI001EFD012D|nr:MULTISPECIES: antibiotic biosynthesis monooxygenase [Vibrio]MCG9596910.1 antibiotic biosynthesis monooxygenase [Vibrio sp. Isolate25]MCG9679849.1 antibiotic biosynthesis monooxygenase [Vibrio sp. Isolate24]USD33544.1 antibiotic biosynthesis monooxygenase [Vibrio sp. SCSIO 43186]USD46612.1 antibiotic biosynthesis monooxygenase [Vibrio sp. SCSIO 43145]USD70668.1 antibiotic biosynthesis monooxygenase [Vibrio sp. SCSIO 43139]
MESEYESNSESKEMIYVTAELKIKPEVQRHEARMAIEQFCRDMENELGCLEAKATYDLEDPSRVILWERYQDRTAIEAHFTMCHTKAFIEMGMTDLVQVFESRSGEVER